MERSAAGKRRHVRCIVKLGGAAITFKNKFEEINDEILFRSAKQLKEAIGGSSLRMEWSNQDVPSKTEKLLDDLPVFVAVHGAGSFGHFQASVSGVNKGGLGALFVHAGFVATRISVTKLNQEVVKALALEGIPAVSVSPFSAGWSTRDCHLASHSLREVERILDAGFVPVLHGDAVLDSNQGCSILSGDVIIRRLAEDLRPEYVVFLTDVAGVYDRPPSEVGAVLLEEILVTKDGLWSVARPKLDHSVRTASSSHDTTGGMATKIAEAASISQLGIDVYIVEAGTKHAARALRGDVRSGGWIGTIVRSSAAEIQRG